MIHVVHTKCGQRKEEVCCYCIPHEDCGVMKDSEWMDKHAKKISDEYKQEKIMWKKAHFPEEME